MSHISSFTQLHKLTIIASFGKPNEDKDSTRNKIIDNVWDVDHVSHKLNYRYIYTL